MTSLITTRLASPPEWASDRVARLTWAVGAVVIGVVIALVPPLLGAVVVACVVALAGAVQKPGWALAMVFLSIPLEFAVLDVGAVGLSAVQMVTLFTVFLMVAEMFATGRFSIPSTPLDVIVFAWLAVTFASAIGAVDPAAAIKKAGITLVFAALYYLVVAKVRRVETVSLLMHSLIVGCSFAAAYGIWVSYRYLTAGIVTGDAMVLGSEGLNVPRAASTVGGPNMLAALMVIGIPVSLVSTLRLKGWARAASIACLALLLVGLGFTFTRGAWLGAAAGLVVLAVEKRTRKTLAVLALILLIATPGAVLDRATTSADFQRNEISHRFDYWEGALLIAERHPLLGVGLNNFEYAFSRLPVPETAQRTALHPHNILLHLLAETGILGLLAFSSFLGAVLTLLMRRWRQDASADRRLWRLAITASLAGSLTQQMTDSLLVEPTVNAVVWVFAGLAVLFAAGWIEDPDEPVLSRAGVA